MGNTNQNPLLQILNQQSDSKVELPPEQEAELIHPMDLVALDKYENSQPGYEDIIKEGLPDIENALTPLRMATFTKFHIVLIFLLLLAVPYLIMSHIVATQETHRRQLMSYQSPRLMFEARKYAERLQQKRIDQITADQKPSKQIGGTDDNQTGE